LPLIIRKHPFDGDQEFSRQIYEDDDEEENENDEDFPTNSPSIFTSSDLSTISGFKVLRTRQIYKAMGKLSDSKEPVLRMKEEPSKKEESMRLKSIVMQDDKMQELVST
jgi:hypothetical protein